LKDSLYDQIMHVFLQRIEARKMVPQKIGSSND
jgi:hypothetical protein